jgi:hypothetical protein
MVICCQLGAVALLPSPVEVKAYIVVVVLPPKLVAAPLAPP